MLIIAIKGVVGIEIVIEIWSWMHFQRMLILVDEPHSAAEPGLSSSIKLKRSALLHESIARIAIFGEAVASENFCPIGFYTVETTR